MNWQKGTPFRNGERTAGANGLLSTAILWVLHASPFGHANVIEIWLCLLFNKRQMLNSQPLILNRMKLMVCPAFAFGSLCLLVLLS